MEEPYRFLKKIRAIGNSVGIILPKQWFTFKENEKVKEMIVEIYSNKIVLLPKKKAK